MEASASDWGEDKGRAAGAGAATGQTLEEFRKTAPHCENAQ
jgi:hypothetical protein